MYYSKYKVKDKWFKRHIGPLEYKDAVVTVQNGFP